MLAGGPCGDPPRRRELLLRLRERSGQDQDVRVVVTQREIIRMVPDPSAQHRQGRVRPLDLEQGVPIAGNRDRIVWKAPYRLGIGDQSRIVFAVAQQGLAELGVGEGAMWETSAGVPENRLRPRPVADRIQRPSARPKAAQLL